jgi:large subunit ribosomal protein L24
LSLAPKVHVKKGDIVKVVAGDNNGKTGKVLEVIPDKGRVVVEGVNIIKKHARPSQKNPQGGIIDRPGPIAAANVMVVCPNCDEAVRTGNVRRSDGSAARTCKRCGKAID